MKYRHFAKEAVLALIGGSIYVFIELVWRGYSHISMFILGGVCFVIIGLINELFPWDLGLLWQSIIGAFVVTICEFVTGLIVNVWLRLGVWDYSGLPFNIMGQICLPFFFAWIALSIVAIILDDYIRYWFFGEEKPHYKFI
jgi:uncharacterized membrane protein|nr:MAG TPA: Putative ABC-transporter type IV [Caudoviricetes sp.]